MAINMQRARELRAAIEEERSSNGDTERLRELERDYAELGKDGAGEKDETRKKKQADVLIELAVNGATLFHAPDLTPFADVEMVDHRETFAIRSKGFRRWLSRRYYEEEQSAPSSEAMSSALNVIEAKAHFDGERRDVCVRIGGADGKLYLDLGDRDWRAVEVDANGWRISERPPVRFRRSSGMQPLPEPTGSGGLEKLRDLLNVKSDEDFVLAVSWVLAAYRDCGPYPVLVLSGEQGAAKSTFSAILRALIDPNTAPLRALPREDRDLFIAANNGRVLAFDNCSGLQPWISDTLCRLATGGGFSVRQLYSDQDEVLFDATRPIILNGITDIVTRADLADRAIFVQLEPIPESDRKPSKELWRTFEEARPAILADLLDGVSAGLRRLPETKLDSLPRMADFAIWATASELAFWDEGAFMAAYQHNRDEAIDSVIEGDLVAAAVRAFMDGRAEAWEGTANDLLAELETAAEERTTRQKAWPNSARSLAQRLRRAATFLRAKQIDISFRRQPGGKRRRTITIETVSR